MMRYFWWRRATLRGQRYFWHLKTRNGEIIAQGQTRGYRHKHDVDRAIELVRGSGAASVEPRR